MAQQFDNAFSGVARLGKWVGGGIVALIMVSWLSPFVVINAGHRGVMTNFGKVETEVLGEGLHLRIPIMQTAHEINVQIQKGEGDGQAASKDLQEIHARIAINYHLNPDKVAATFQEVGNLETVGDRIIQPSVQEAVKATTAKYTAEELISRRAEVRDNISLFMRERLHRHGIILDEFSIVNFDFSNGFKEAIEAKSTAEQLTLKAQQDLLRIKVEAEQKVATAKAEAESLRLQKQEVTPELIQLRAMENQAKAIAKWDGHLPQYTGGPVPMIGVDQRPAQPQR